MFPRVTEYVHQLLRERVQEGDTVIDATVGNGHDTLFLAQLVGEKGKVIGYDIQQQALDSTRKLLAEYHLLSRVTLHLQSHDQMKPPPASCSAVVFNLGYLPGSDKSITTTWETTLPAIDKSLSFLKVGGVLILVIYWGHQQGKEEKRMIERYVEELPYPKYMVLKYQYVNPRNHPPFVLAVERRK